MIKTRTFFYRYKINVKYQTSVGHDAGIADPRFLKQKWNMYEYLNKIRCNEYLPPRWIIFPLHRTDIILVYKNGKIQIDKKIKKIPEINARFRYPSYITIPFYSFSAIKFWTIFLLWLICFYFYFCFCFYYFFSHFFV